MFNIKRRPLVKKTIKNVKEAESFRFTFLIFFFTRERLFILNMFPKPDYSSIFNDNNNNNNNCTIL